MTSREDNRRLAEAYSRGNGHRGLRSADSMMSMADDSRQLHSRLRRLSRT